MESTLHPLDYQALAREALDGGFTQALDGFRPTSGYVVSTRPDAERVIPNLSAYSDMMNEGAVGHAIYLYVIDHGHDLRHGYLLGAWRDGDRVVLDLVQVFEDYHEAMRAARANGQDAIYDVLAQSAVWVESALLDWLDAQRDAADELERLDAQRDAELARWDDDPNPYHGDYSEE